MKVEIKSGLVSISAPFSSLFWFYGIVLFHSHRYHYPTVWPTSVLSKYKKSFKYTQYTARHQPPAGRHRWPMAGDHSEAAREVHISIFT